MKLKFASWLFVPSLAVAVLPSVQAADSNWNTTTGDWNVPGNWTGGVPTATVPGSEEANISNGGSATISSAVPNVQNIYVARGGGNTGSVTIAAGGSVTITGTGESLKIGTDGGTGILNQTGGTLSQTTGEFRLGNYGSDATGTYNLSGGTAAVNQVRMGTGNATQTGILNQTGGALTSTGEFQVGTNGAIGFYNLSGATTTANINSLRIGQDGNSKGTLTQTGGTLATTDEVFVGLNGGNGTYTLSGGALTTTNRIRLAVGNNSVANFNQSGGSVSINGRLDISEDGGSGTYNISGGTLSVNSEIFAGAFGSAGTGTFTQSGGTVTAPQLRLAFGAAKTGVANLNGGVLQVDRIWRETSGPDTGGTAYLNFNGGTAQARSSQGSFISGITAVDIQAGGAIIDSNGFDIGIQSDMSGAGGLTKTGAGTLSIGSVSTYLGNTVINQGLLTIAGSGSIEFDINASGVNNMITGNGIGTLDISGTISFDLTDAPAVGLWTIVDNANLAGVTYGSGFEVDGFTSGDGILWTSGNFTFDRSTGVLSAIPEPSSLALLAPLAGLALIRRRRF